MATKNRNALYEIFSTGNKPTQDDFVDLIDSAINIADDGIGAADPGKPVEFVAQGTGKRYLDLSSLKDTPTFRLTAVSSVGGTSGLNIYSKKTSRFFLEEDSGDIGINTDNPNAKIDVVTKLDDNAFQLNELKIVDNETIKKPYLTIKHGGKTVLAQEKAEGETYEGITLTVNGNSAFEGTVSVADALEAKKGMSVNGSKLKAFKGIDASEGITVNTGQLVAKGGAAVSGGPLNAEAGAVIKGGNLQQEGLVVEQGVTVSEGQLLAKNGATISNAQLVADAGLAVNNAELIAYAGATINNAELIANKGITVKEVLLTALKGAKIDGAPLDVLAGLNVNDSLLAANKGAEVNGGEFVANLGASINEAQLFANKGATINGGELIANNGATINKEQFVAKKGVKVEGAPLLAQAGAVIEQEFDAGGTVNLGTTFAQSMEVTGVLKAAQLDLSDNDLQVKSLTATGIQAANANIDNLETGKELKIGGEFYATSNAFLGNEQLIVSFEGTAEQTALVRLVEDKSSKIVREGHFHIDVTDTIVTISYNNQSNISNLISDWNTYKGSNPGKAKQFHIHRIGGNPCEFEETEETLYSSKSVFKAFQIYKKGLHFIFSGTETENPNPNVKIVTNNDTTITKFEFSIDAGTLTIKRPVDAANQIAGKLIEDWTFWKFKNSSVASSYEIQQRPDDSWMIVDAETPVELQLTGVVARECQISNLTIRHNGLQDTTEIKPVKVVSAVDDEETSDGPVFNLIDDYFEITLGKVANNPKLVSESWSEWIKNNDSQGFEIVPSDDVNVITLTQEENLAKLNDEDTSAHLEISGYKVSYHAETPEGASGASIKIDTTTELDFKFHANPDTKVLTISYPVDITKRKVVKILEDWGKVNEDLKHGFEVGPSDYIVEENVRIVQKKSVVMDPVETYRDYLTPTLGVDEIRVVYNGPSAHTPKIKIVSQSDGANANEFSIQIDPSTQLLTILYPKDKNGTVDQLMSEWNLISEKHNFTIVQNKIEEIVVEDRPGDVLTKDPENNVFKKGAIRLNSVVFSGNLKFSNSNVSIKNFSTNSSLEENSDTVVSTQKAIKSYVDTYKALKNGEITEDFKAASLVVHGDFRLDETGHPVNTISNDTDLTNSSQNALPTEYAIKSYVDTYKALKNGEITEDFKAASLVVHGNFRLDEAGHPVNTISNDTDLTNSSQNALPTEYAIKSYVDTYKALKNGETTEDFKVANMVVHGDFRLDETGHPVGSISNDTDLANSSQNAIPTENAVRVYADTKALKAGEEGQSFTTNDLTIYGGFGFNETATKLTKVSLDLETETDLSVVLPNGSAVTAYTDSRLAIFEGSTGVDFNARNLSIVGNFQLGTGATVAKVTTDISTEANQDGSIPNATAIVNYVNEITALNRANSTLDYSAKDVRVDGELKFDDSGLVVSKISSDIDTEAEPAIAIPTVQAIRDYSDTSKAPVNGHIDNNFETNDLNVTGNLTLGSSVMNGISANIDAEANATGTIPTVQAVKDHVAGKADIKTAPGAGLDIGIGASAAAVSGLSSNSNGLVVVRNIVSGGVTELAVFAIHGNSTVSKVSGEDTSYNLSFSGSNLMVENIASAGITAYITFLGA